MNCIVQKSDNTVIWINPDQKKLTGQDTWSGFNETKHNIIFAKNYNPQIGQEFKADVDSNGVAKEFEVKQVWNKTTKQERTLWNWDDEIDSATETDKEPLHTKVDDQKIYKQFQKFENGNWVVDTVAENESKVPKRLTPAQARLKLLHIGKLSEVETLMKEPNTLQEAKILWEYATYFDRQNPTFIQLATAIGLTSSQIDDLFIEGAKLNV